ncbi:MAG: lipopolysaccharide export system protein LptA, partial [Saprospiraceae bacterium]
KKTVFLKENRNMDFDGKLYSGYSVFEGKNFHFDYDNFSITLDSVRYFDLFVPTGIEDERGNKEALSLASRIEYLSGVLLIDAPENKSGREEIPIFPSIQSKKPSFVFYDDKSIQKGVYNRDSFFFELKPFAFNSLDNFTAESIDFDGNLVSFDIFPDIKEKLVVREEDQSLGFATDTPAEGFPAYKNTGNYKGVIDLSNKGLQGKGLLTYLDAEINSEDLVFRPQNTTGSADVFDLDEKRNATPEIPQVHGVNVDILWRPYNDSLFVTAEEAPFEMFKDGQHTLRGTTILTPDGLKGNGLFDWTKASMTSNTFSFGAFSTVADTSDLKIRAFDADDLALVTDNLNAVVDFDKQIGNFKANDEFLTTSLPYNQYETSFNEFDWDIKGEIITFKAEEGKKGRFLSVHPDQDSLRFLGDAASYNLKTSTLNITGVDEIISADAFIYPDSGLVDVIKGGKMTLLKNARIEADTINKYHVINRAEVQVLGKKEFRAEGFYEYNIGDVEQEIRFDEIVGTRIGKGSRAEKVTATRATGEVSSEKEFFIDHKTLYRGTISLFSETPNLKFDGYARIKSTSLRRLHWFTVSFNGDKSDLKIKYDVPKNYQAEPLRTGLYLSKENNRVYSNIMAPLYFRKDRPVLPVTGYMDYDRTRDVYVFGDSLKILQDGLKGNKLTYYESTGEVKSEGKYNIGDNLKYISIQAAGRANAEPMPTDTVRVVIPKITGDFMLALDLLLPDDLKKFLIQDFQGSSFDAQSINYSDGKSFYQKAASELFPEKETKKILNSLDQGVFDISKKVNKSNLLFSKVPMQWDPDYQSFVSSKATLSLASIDGQMINKDITAYIEVKMPQRGDDRLYVYLKSPSNLYYFFGFKEGIMNIVSDNPKFNDYILNMKDKYRIKKMPDGETFEIQPVNDGTARQFVSRVKATW